jgi:hypothetical protein
MKILILDNLFNTNFIIPLNISKLLNKFIIFYEKLKVHRLIEKLKSDYKGNIEIIVISDRPEQKYMNDKKGVLIELYKNLIKLQQFQIENLFIGDLIEIHFANFLNTIFGKFEILLRVLETEDYDKAVIINSSPYLLDFYKYLNRKFKNIFLFEKKNSIVKYLSKIPIFILIIYVLRILYNSILAFGKDVPYKESLNETNRKNIYFISYTNNQFNAIKDISFELKDDRELKPIHFHQMNQISFTRIHLLIKFIHEIKHFWYKNLDYISKDLSYNTVPLKEIFRKFYRNYLFIDSLIIFNVFYKYKKIFKMISPSLIVLTNEFNMEQRLLAKYSKIKNILSLHIPHASLEIYEEMITRTDITYLCVPGERGKEYLLRKGEPENKIIVTGKPNYEKYYKGNIKRLTEIRDMFDNRIYQFNPNKFSIVLTTNPIDYNANRHLLITVIESIKEANLIENLIIKLHPREDGLFHKKIFNELNCNPIIVKDVDILQLINSCDLLISRISNTILEGIIMGTPVIILDFLNTKFTMLGTYLFIDDRFIISVKDKQSLTSNILKLTKNKDFYLKYSKFLTEEAKKYSYYNELEKPKEIIIKLIKTLVNKQYSKNN